MKKVHQLAIVMTVLAVLVGGGIWFPVAGQQRPREDVLDALLVEVRGLRGAIEHMASASARVQLITSRLQLQEQRLNTMLPRLAEQRDRLAAAEREVVSHQAQLADLQSDASKADSGHFGSGADADILRAQITNRMKATKQDLALHARDVERLRADEAELAALVGAEQARWTTINKQLEELEALLRK